MSRRNLRIGSLEYEILEYIRTLHKEFVAKDIIEEFDEENPRKVIGSLMQLRIDGYIESVGRDNSRGGVKIWRLK